MFRVCFSGGDLVLYIPTINLHFELDLYFKYIKIVEKGQNSNFVSMKAKLLKNSSTVVILHFLLVFLLLPLLFIYSPQEVFSEAVK